VQRRSFVWGSRLSTSTSASPPIDALLPHASWADPSQDTQYDRLGIRRSTGTDGTAPALGTLSELFQTKIGMKALGQVWGRWSASDQGSA
jgi:hypothetical protein